MAANEAGVRPAARAKVSDEDPAFAQIVETIKAMPKPNRKFETVMRAWKRAGLLPAGDARDAKLLAAWDAWKAAVGRIEDVGSADSAYEYNIRARDEAEDVLVQELASTPAGAAAKLRFALDMGNAPAWVGRAVVAGDDLKLFARADELPSEWRAVVDALALPVRPADRTVRDAFEAWVAARLAYDADPSSDDAGDGPLFEAIGATEAALAQAIPRSAEDMLYKLLPLALQEHGPVTDEGTFAIRWKPQRLEPMYLDDQAWRGLIDGMLALSPRIAEVVAMPHPRHGLDSGAAQTFDRIAHDYVTTRERVKAEGGSEPDGGPIIQAYEAAADAIDAAVPTSFEQFARKFVCVHADGRPSPEIEQELIAQARRLLGDRPVEQAA